MSRKTLEALAKGPVKVQIGQRSITLTRMAKSYQIVLQEPGKKPQCWQYRSPYAIERFETLVDLLRRNP